MNDEDLSGVPVTKRRIPRTLVTVNGDRQFIVYSSVALARALDMFRFVL